MIIAKTKVVARGGGYVHQVLYAGCWCSCKIAGKLAQSFTYMSMLFHEDRHIKHAICARYSKCFSRANIFPLEQHAGIRQVCAAFGVIAAGHSAAFCFTWL